MDSVPDFIEARVEQVLRDDDSDPVTESLGSFEQKVAQVVLLISSAPTLLAPFAYHYFRKNLYQLVLILLACIVAIFLIVQYRFTWILELVDRFDQVIHA